MERQQLKWFSFNSEEGTRWDRQENVMVASGFSGKCRRKTTENME